MRIIVSLLGLILLIFPSALAFISPKDDLSRPAQNSSPKVMLAGDQPIAEIAVHKIGNTWLTITNIGQFGLGYLGAAIDPISGLAAPSCIFPAGSNINYLYVAGFWIGAIVGRDTLVSIGVDDYYNVVEFWPSPKPEGNIEMKSIQSSNQFYDETAISEQDIIAVYTDTVTDSRRVATDPTDGRGHIPLNIEITQRSFAWSYEYAQDFILFDYSVKNIGNKKLRQVYMAIYVDGDVHHTSLSGADAYMEDMCGFLRTFPAEVGCGFVDTINLAYIMDNDGDPENTTSFGQKAARGVAGIRVVRTPSDSLSYSFNWWVTDYDPSHDFGPRQLGTITDPFRELSGVLGTPPGDRNKYYIMRHREFDYDQMFTAVNQTAAGWLPPPNNGVDIANGFDTRYLLSFGPFDISPGEVLPITFAFVCADSVHTHPGDFNNYYNATNPTIFYNTLNFSAPARNSMWASWVYDNPGYCSDTSNPTDLCYRGKYRVCVYDSTLKIDTSGQPPVIETTTVYNKADTT
ncbi:MAG: hypothetical protein NTV06_08955 [candidate division Zixibacteria bacterium]|nr:hypothetical protein [candidate division Zixibacteria bacterium]